jgi:hypothetical protein
MTIAYARRSDTVDRVADLLVLDGGVFFQPLPVVEQARRYASEGTDLVVRLRLDGAASRLSGVSGMLLEASVETRLRHALTAAGFRHIERRHEDPGVVSLHARA